MGASPGGNEGCRRMMRLKKHGILIVACWEGDGSKESMGKVDNRGCNAVMQ